MKRSFKLRIAISFILLVAAALAAIGIVNLVFMDKVYLREKQRTLEKSYSLLNETGVDTTTEEVDRYCTVNALTYAITDANLTVVYTNAQDAEGMASRLFGSVLRIEEENMTILKSEDLYQVVKYHDRMSGIDYLELWGVLSNENYFLAYAPLESIDEAARLSSRFYMLIGLVVILISVVLILLLTKRLTKPVQELTTLSRRMADLDFDARYTSGGEDEIGVLGENFNSMSEKLEQTISELKSANAQLMHDVEEKTRIDERRREFLANVSHELKTPIALIQGYAEGLKDQVGDEESRDFYCDVITDEASKMNRMVRQLMTLDELESGTEQIRMERFDLAALIRGIVDSEAILVGKAEAQIRFEESGPVMVWGDSFQIEELVTNYLNNALNHLDGERRIEIRIWRQSGVVVTEVFNTGAPIPENELPRIWEKFYKTDKARTRAYGGSGIGLSIVRAIMDRHGQRCWAENKADGVSFYFTLDADEGFTLGLS